MTDNEQDKIVYSMVLCHSNSRCAELVQFANDLTRFCSDIIDVVIFDQLDFQDVKLDWAKRTKKEDHKVDDDEA